MENPTEKKLGQDQGTIESEEKRELSEQDLSQVAGGVNTISPIMKVPPPPPSFITTLENIMESTSNTDATVTGNLK